MFDKKYNFYVGTARGTISCAYANETKLRFEPSDEPSEITSLIWGPNNQIITGYKNGNVYVFDIGNFKYIEKFKLLKNEIIGLGTIDDTIISCTNEGRVSYLESKEKDYFQVPLKENSIVHRAVQNINNKNSFATGGECNDLTIWNLETKQACFKAKSLGHDFLNLPIKTSIRGITFIPEYPDISCCCTKEGHVLCYDIRAQRKPVVTFHNEKASYTSIACSFRERNVMVGTTKGYIQYIDMKMGKPLRTYTGISGSVTDIVCDALEPYVTCVSLDKFLRVYHLETKQLLHKQYLKQNLCKLLIQPIVKDEIIEEQCDEYDEIFDQMEVVTDVPKKHKHKECKKVKKRIKV